MPINNVKRLIHFTTKKNNQVKHNINRLQKIAFEAKTAQDILDALHPWHEDKALYFYNALSYFFIITALCILIFGGLLHAYIPYIYSIFFAIFSTCWAYLIYENDDDIEEVISILEQKMTWLKYDLAINQVPNYLSATSSSLFLINQLREKFSILSLGQSQNEIDFHASTLWKYNNQELHTLLVRYHYVDEIFIPNKDLEKQKIKEIHRYLYGAFIFQQKSLGFAASNKRQNALAPFSVSWKSSDISLNQKLQIYGTNQLQLAKIITPKITLKLDELFQSYTGDLVYHPSDPIVCFLVDQNLFRVSKQKQKIRDVSQLRGHLRTLSMPEYENFKSDFSQFIAS